MTRRLASAAAALALAACSGKNQTTWLCDPGRQTGCSAGQYCETVGGNLGAACFAPVVIAGNVFDVSGVSTIYVNGARVVALDANRAPVSSVGQSGAGGGYEVAVRASRDIHGGPVSTKVTLRADAQLYQTFPGGLRPALPIDLASALPINGRWVVNGPLTQVELLPLAGAGAASISGTVPRVAGIAPPLVVAQPPVGGGAMTGIADVDGGYAIFNLTPGVDYVVKAYAQGANYPTTTTGPLGSGLTPNVNLATPTPATAAFGADVIANNSPNPGFQVTLVVDSTYVSTLDRGDSPPGLTVPGSFGNPGYTFSGVPDGTYRVLAAFGIDGDVRDVSGGGNTASPQVTVAGGAVQGTPPGFKIIPAVDLRTIDGTTVGPDPVIVSTTAPEFAWTRHSVDSSAKTYRVVVLDAYGNVAWSSDQGVSPDNTATYAGAALVSGRPYQLRILALEQTPADLVADPLTITQKSQTEDLLGVFLYRP